MARRRRCWLVVRSAQVERRTNRPISNPVGARRQPGKTQVADLAKG